MKILTLNTWAHYGPYEERWQYLLEELASLDPDVICLQEVVDSVLTEQIRKQLSFSDSFEAYDFGLVTLMKSRASLAKVFNFETQSPTEKMKRGALFAQWTSSKGQKILIGNTHLSWKTKEWDVRQKQARELLIFCQKSRQLTLLAGDFNDTPDSKPLLEVKKAGHLDLYEKYHSGKEKVTWDNQNSFIQTHRVKFPNRRIDFLWMDQKLLAHVQVLGCDIVLDQPNPDGFFVSDHYGVLADLQER